MQKNKNKPMLFEAWFSSKIRKDGWISCDNTDGRAYIIATDFEEAAKKAIKAFVEWKAEKVQRKDCILEKVTLIDDEPIF